MRARAWMRCLAHAPIGVVFFLVAFALVIYIHGDPRMGVARMGGDVVPRGDSSYSLSSLGGGGKEKVVGKKVAVAITITKDGWVILGLGIPFPLNLVLS